VHNTRSFGDRTVQCRPVPIAQLLARLADEDCGRLPIAAAIHDADDGALWVLRAVGAASVRWVVC
jgi:hypothetical protein